MKYVIGFIVLYMGIASCKQPLGNDAGLSNEVESQSIFPVQWESLYPPDPTIAQRNSKLAKQLHEMLKDRYEKYLIDKENGKDTHEDTVVHYKGLDDERLALLPDTQRLYDLFMNTLPVNLGLIAERLAVYDAKLNISTERMQKALEDSSEMERLTSEWSCVKLAMTKKARDHWQEVFSRLDTHQQIALMVRLQRENGDIIETASNNSRESYLVTIKQGFDVKHQDNIFNLYAQNLTDLVRRDVIVLTDNSNCEDFVLQEKK